MIPLTELIHILTVKVKLLLEDLKRINNFNYSASDSD